MNLIEDLTQTELLKINGGESFAYRVGQAIAFIAYKSTSIPTYGGIKAENDLLGR